MIPANRPGSLVRVPPDKGAKKDDPGDAPLRRPLTLAKPSFAAIKNRLSHRLKVPFSDRCCTKGTQFLAARTIEYFIGRPEN